jgi:uncharacterized Zn finger protein
MSVPVTAKLSRRFYEQLGDEAADELVNWFNAVDADYRAQLERTNDLNWERFKAELRAGLTGLGSELRVELHTEIAKLRVELHSEIAKLHRWMFVYWSTMMLTLLGMFFGFVQRK